MAAGNRLDYQRVMEAQNRAISDLMKSSDFPSALLPCSVAAASQKGPQGVAVGVPQQQPYHVQAPPQHMDCENYMPEVVPGNTWSINDWTWDPINMLARPLDGERCQVSQYGPCSGGVTMSNKTPAYSDMMHCDGLSNSGCAAGCPMGPCDYGQPLERTSIMPTKPAEMKCQIEGCTTDIRKLKPYHRRHRICEEHERDPEVSINGRKMRFCQMCGRVQPVEDFDGLRRTCRDRLASHNRRRRAKRNPQAYRDEGKVPHFSLHASVKREKLEPKEEHFQVDDYLLPNVEYPMLAAEADNKWLDTTLLVPNISSGGEGDSSDMSNGPSQGQELNLSGNSGLTEKSEEAVKGHGINKVDPPSYDPQVMNNRLLTKMMGRDPGDLPNDLRERVEEWLGESPLSSTAYIRPGCVCLTADVLTPAVPRCDWNGKTFKEVQDEVAGMPEAWLEILTSGTACCNKLASGFSVAQVGDNVAMCTDGRITNVSSAESTIKGFEGEEAGMPRVLDVFPRAVDGTLPNVLTLRVAGSLHGQKDLICRFNGQIVPLTVLEVSAGGFVKVGMPPLVVRGTESRLEGGVASFEILIRRGVLASDAKPVLVTVDQRIADELAHAASLLEEDGIGDALLTDFGSLLSHAQLVTSLSSSTDPCSTEQIDSLCDFWCDAGEYLSAFLSGSVKAPAASRLVNSILHEVFGEIEQGLFAAEELVGCCPCNDDIVEESSTCEDQVDRWATICNASSSRYCESNEDMTAHHAICEASAPTFGGENLLSLDKLGSIEENAGLLWRRSMFLAFTAATGVCFMAMSVIFSSTINKGSIFLQQVENGLHVSSWVA